MMFVEFILDNSIDSVDVDCFEFYHGICLFQFVGNNENTSCLIDPVLVKYNSRSVIMHHFLCTFFLSAIFLFNAESIAGYGDVANSLPSWKERQILVLTNACRMSPAQYRDAYVGNYAILDSAKYPAVAPLYLSPQLNASGRGHALDMGDTCGTLQHNSCNGTAWDTRIKSYYAASSWIGENIAVGNSDPFVTMNQWIKDNPQGSDQPAGDFSWCKTSTKDSSRCDGHRSNIMNKQYKEMGIGYAYGANSAVQYHHFWVQDFGGGASAVLSPIVSGTHFLKETGKITFMANYWDPALKAPTEASISIAGQKNAMTLAMGTAFRGTYQFALSRGTQCRTYFFSFIDGSGKTWRYPEIGFLVTAGEGSCISEYESLTSQAKSPIDLPFAEIASGMRAKISRSSIIITASKGALFPQSTFLIDAKGRVLFYKRWRVQAFMTKEGAEIVFKTTLPEGVYFLVHRISNTNSLYEKIVLIK
jgi:hypothetical protein